MMVSVGKLSDSSETRGEKLDVHHRLGKFNITGTKHALRALHKPIPGL